MWLYLCLLALFCLFPFRALTAQFSTQTSFSKAPDTDGTNYFNQGINPTFTVHNGGSFPAVLSWSFSADSGYQQVLMCGAGSTASATPIMSGDPINGSSYWMSKTYPFRYTGLSSSNSSVSATSDGGSIMVYYRWDINSVQTSGSFSLVCPSATLSVTYKVGIQSGVFFQQPNFLFTIEAGDLTIGKNSVPPRGELEMVLFNKSASKILMSFGSKLIELAPGMNRFRYDGPLDSFGLPKISPPGMNATKVSSGGSNYLVGELSASPLGGAIWGSAPVVPPSNPDATHSLVSLRTDVGLGVVVALSNSNGTQTVGVINPPPIQTSSNTTGLGAVISDSTLPKPAQTIANTTNSTTNITNNGGSTSIVSTTNINSDGKALSPEQSAQVQSIPEDVTPSTPSLGSLSGTVLDVGSALSSKFNSLDLVAKSGVPKVSSYTMELNLGPYGNLTRTIDFTKNPFPAVRAAMVAMTTLFFGLAFLRRSTI